MTEQDKREKIVAAAYEVLSEKGYDRASTKEIARTAGVAQGLINYYFPSKDKLFAEVFICETRRYCKSFEHMKSYGEKPLNMDTLREILMETKERAASDPDWFRLRYELIAIGLRDEKASGVLKEMLALKREHLTAIVEAIAHLPKEQSEPIASILFTIFDGLGLQKIADPEFDYDRAYETLTVMLGAYLEVLKKQNM